MKLYAHLPPRFAVIALAFVAAAACQADVVEAQDRDALIAACKVEAGRGHLQGLLDERRKHQARMVAICEEWRNVTADEREDLSVRCLAEARRGPSMGHRQRPMNQSHMFRQGELCRQLAVS